MLCSSGNFVEGSTLDQQGGQKLLLEGFPLGVVGDDLDPVAI